MRGTDGGGAEEVTFVTERSTLMTMLGGALHTVWYEASRYQVP